MPQSYSKTVRLIGEGLLAALAMYLMAESNYLLFHSVAEGFAIVVALLIHVLATRTYRYSGHSFLLFLGYAFFFIAVLDFLHLMTYQGMGVFPGYGPNMPTQLWVAGRFLMTVSFILAPLFIRRRFSPWPVLSGYAVVTAGLVLLIMYFKRFPDCFIPGQGLTPFKIASEYVFSGLLLVACWMLYRRRELLDRSLYLIVTAAVLTTVVSEMTFTLYRSVYDTMNFLGHLFKVGAYGLIYSGVAMRGLDAPFEMIFRDLKKSAVTDPLTGLYNRQGFQELVDKLLPMSKCRYPLGVLLMDIDRFKTVNDEYGHLAGDRVLKRFAEILRASIRETDAVCRLGGDEFIVLLRTDRKGLHQVEGRIRKAMEAWFASEETTRKLGLSIGSALWDAGEEPPDIDDLLRLADREMYREKEASRGDLEEKKGATDVENIL